MAPAKARTRGWVMALPGRMSKPRSNDLQGKGRATTTTTWGSLTRTQGKERSWAWVPASKGLSAVPGQQPAVTTYSSPIPKVCSENK